MEPFKTFRGVVAGIDRANIDTDAIIPKQFLKSIRRDGFGEGLFWDWRFLPDGAPNPDFSLNAPQCEGASILVARNNFGCGSSREHAVWAVMQYGFRTVIAPWREGTGGIIPGFADIFRGNSSKNGLLTVELPPHDVDRIFAMIETGDRLEATVDLESQALCFHAASGDVRFQFEIDPTVKDTLLRGLDDIGLTLEHAAAIKGFEATRPAWLEMTPTTPR